MSTINEQKDSLVAATFYYADGSLVKTAQPDSRWEKGGTERLSFEHPSHRRIIGAIEIDSTVDVIRDVRLELVLPPDVAEKVLVMLMAEPVEVIVEPVVEVVSIAEAPVVMPPTKDPTAADLEEMRAEEEEEMRDLPPPVDANIIDLSVLS